MLQAKRFVKRTRRGGVLSVVREHYLRDDIWMGLADADHGGVGVLEAAPSVQEGDLVGPCWLVPDVDVVVHQADMLSHPAVRNVVFLQTVLEAADAQGGLDTTRRLRALADDTRRCAFVYSNEHAREAYVQRAEHETPAQRGARAVRAAVAVYARRAQASRGEGQSVRVVLLADSTDQRSAAEADGLVAMSSREYARLRGDVPSLVDMVAEHTGAPLAASSRDAGGPLAADALDAPYPPYLSAAEVSRGVQAGTLYQGVLHVMREDPDEAAVTVPGWPTPVAIVGPMDRNRSLHGDAVAVALHPPEQWRAVGLAVPVVDVVGAANEAEEEHADPIAQPATLGAAADGGAGATQQQERGRVPGPGEQASGHVVAVVRRFRHDYCGTLLPDSEVPADSADGEEGGHDEKNGSDLAAPQRRSWYLVEPADPRFPSVRMATGRAGDLRGMRIVVHVDSWPRQSRYPHGHVVRTLGRAGDRRTESDVLLVEQEIPYAPFSDQVTACLPSVPWQIPAEEMAGREDLRALPICTVDPPGCTDMDDALHCRPLPPAGGARRWEVGVHIADVAHFVKTGTALDGEAAERGTTIYLVDRRIDMLPELLGTDLCSLRANEDRLAFSVLWELDDGAQIVGTRFAKTVIRSRAALTYEQAQLRIVDPSARDEVTEGLRCLSTLARALRRRRSERGALTLASAEVSFNLDSETHDPIDLQSKVLRDTNAMVEEFMLLANVSVAEATFARYRECAVLRRHPAPPPGAFAPLERAARAAGVALDVSSSLALARSLEGAQRDGDPYFGTLLRMAATRCMMQAVYVCSGSVADRDFHHYGLAAPIYTHFTSPIRRYADIMVHRLLACVIGRERPSASLLDRARVERRCRALNRRARAAQRAGRDSIDLFAREFFARGAPGRPLAAKAARPAADEGSEQAEDAYVMRVWPGGVTAVIPRYGVEAPLDMAGLDYAYREAESRWQRPTQPASSPARLPSTLAMFDKIRVAVRVVAEGAGRRQLRLRLQEPLTAADADSPAESKKSRRH